MALDSAKQHRGALDQLKYSVLAKTSDLAEPEQLRLWVDDLGDVIISWRSLIRRCDAQIRDLTGQRRREVRFPFSMNRFVIHVLWTGTGRVECAGFTIGDLGWDGMRGRR